MNVRFAFQLSLEHHDKPGFYQKPGLLFHPSTISWLLIGLIAWLILVPSQTVAAQSVNIPLPLQNAEILALLPSPYYATDHTFYLLTPDRLYRTTNDGEAWEYAGDLFELTGASFYTQATLAESPENGHQLLLADRSSLLWRINPTQLTWLSFTPPAQTDCWATSPKREQIPTLPPTTPRTQPLLRVDGVDAMALSPDGNELAYATAEGVVIQSMDGGGQYQPLLFGDSVDANAVRLQALAWSSNGCWLAGIDKTHLWVWQKGLQQPMQRMEGSFPLWARPYWSPDSKRIALDGKEGVQLYAISQAREGEATLRRQLQTTLNEAIAWSPNGRWLATDGHDGSDQTVVQLWDGATGRRIQQWTGHGPHTGSTAWDERGNLAWSPDDSLLASGSVSGTVRVWNVAEGEEVARIDTGATFMLNLAWSPNGRWLAIGGAMDGTLLLWDRQADTTRALLGHTKRVQSLRWTADSRRLASAAQGEPLHIWDAEQGWLVATLGDAVSALVDWSWDGRWLAALDVGLPATEGEQANLIEHGMVWDIARLFASNEEQPTADGLLARHRLPFYAFDVQTLRASPDFINDQTLYLQTATTLFRTTDAGESWQTVPISKPISQDLAPNEVGGRSVRLFQTTLLGESEPQSTLWFGKGNDLFTLNTNAWQPVETTTLPGGEQLGYLATDAPVPNLTTPTTRLTLVDGASSRSVTLPTSDSPIRWSALSPQGNWVFFYRGDAGGTCDAPRFTPPAQGKFSYSLHLYNIVTDEERTIAELLPADFPANFAQTLSELAQSGENQTSQLGLSAEELWQTFLCGIDSAAWSPDGSQLAFAGAMDGLSSDLYLYDLASQQTTRLTTGLKQVAEIAWSPDGQWILNSGATRLPGQAGEGQSDYTYFVTHPDGSALQSLDLPQSIPAATVTSTQPISLTLPLLTSGWVAPAAFLYQSQDAEGVPTLYKIDLNQINPASGSVGQATLLWSGTMDHFAADPTQAMVGLVGQPPARDVGLYALSLTDDSTQRLAAGNWSLVQEPGETGRLVATQLAGNGALNIGHIQVDPATGKATLNQEYRPNTSSALSLDGEWLASSNGYDVRVAANLPLAQPLVQNFAEMTQGIQPQIAWSANELLVAGGERLYALDIWRLKQKNASFGSPWRSVPDWGWLSLPANTEQTSDLGSLQPFTLPTLLTGTLNSVLLLPAIESSQTATPTLYALLDDHLVRTSDLDNSERSWQLAATPLLYPSAQVIQAQAIAALNADQADEFWLLLQADPGTRSLWRTASARLDWLPLASLGAEQADLFLAELTPATAMTVRYDTPLHWDATSHLVAQPSFLNSRGITDTQRVRFQSLLALQEGEPASMLLISERIPSSDPTYTCATCYVALDAARFLKSEQGWQLTTQADGIFTAASGYGKLPEGKVLQLGPNKQGVYFVDQWTDADGVAHWQMTIVAEIGGVLRALVQFDAGAEDGQGEGKPKTFRYSATPQFVRGQQPLVDDLMVNYAGTQTVNGVVQSYRESIHFVFDGVVYQAVAK